jgi:transcriptional regulator with XRE-family HTH domain
MDNAERFRMALIRLRVRKGLTQGAIVDRMPSVSHQASLSRKEHGVRPFTLDDIAEYLAACDCDLVDLGNELLRA